MNSTFSFAVNTGTRLYAWKTKPIFFNLKSMISLGPKFEMLILSIITSPLVGVSSPPIRFNNVVLPQPDGPIIAVNSPFSNSIVTLLTA